MDVFRGCLNFPYTFPDKYGVLSWFQREIHYFMSYSVMHFLLRTPFLILSVCLGSLLDFRDFFLEFTRLGNIFAVEELLRSPDSLGAPLAKRDFFINATFAFPFSLIFLLYMYFFLELTIMTWDSERVYRFSMPRLILLQYIRWAEGTDWCIERSSGTVFNPCWLDFPRLFF